MASYPEYDENDLTRVTGRADYGDFADEAIRQATLLFKLATCLESWPDDETAAELAEMALLSMADSVYMGQQYAETMANPFTSETIGSYSYSKKQAQAVSSGQQTGVPWFDRAVDLLSVCENLGIGQGAIDVFHAGTPTETSVFYGPADLNRYWDWYFSDPAPAEMYGGKSLPAVVEGQVAPP